MQAGTVQVIATANGYDGVKVREPGEVFIVPASVFTKRPRFVLNDRGEKVADGFYSAPSWFEEAVEAPAPRPSVMPKSRVPGSLDLVSPAPEGAQGPNPVGADLT